MSTNDAGGAPRSGLKAVLWTLVCPGLGEYRLGHRVLGATIGISFVAVCVWLVVGTYGMVQDIAEYVKTADPTLNAPPESGEEAARLIQRLALAIHAEYQNRRAAIHAKMWVPIWILFIMYCYSLVQSYVLGVRKDRAAAGEAGRTCNDPPGTSGSSPGLAGASAASEGSGRSPDSMPTGSTGEGSTATAAPSSVEPGEPSPPPPPPAA